MSRVILWDFDGTLGYREGAWEAAIFEVAGDRVPKSPANFGTVAQMLESGFPWHAPEQSFAELLNSADWWAFVRPVFARIFSALGFDPAVAADKAALVQDQYARPDKWRLYDDAIPCMNALHLDGWRHVLVSNNIPEFAAILEHLAIGRYFEAVFVSSRTGFNKTNPLILDGYLETLPPDARIIVVGDRVESDLQFAAAIGAEGILVRSAERVPSRSFTDLRELSRYLLTINTSQDA